MLRAIISMKKEIVEVVRMCCVIIGETLFAYLLCVIAIEVMSTVNRIFIDNNTNESLSAAYAAVFMVILVFAVYRMVDQIVIVKPLDHEQIKKDIEAKRNKEYTANKELNT